MLLRTAVTVAVICAALTAAGAQEEELQCQTLGTVLQEKGLTNLDQAVQYFQGYPQAEQLIGLTTTEEELPPEEQVTIFAPSNQAFESYLVANPELAQALEQQTEPGQGPQPVQPGQRRLQQEQPQGQPQEQGGQQDQETQQRLYEVLGAHVVPGRHTVQDILREIRASPEQEYTLETLENQVLVFTTDNIYTFNEDDVSTADVETAEDGDDIGVDRRATLLVSVQGSEQPAQALLTDIDAPSCTGPVHVITEVLEPSEEQPGQEEPGQQEPGQEQPGQEQPGQQPGQEQPGQQQPGQQQPGQQPGQEPQPGQQPQGGQQPQPGQQPRRLLSV